MAASTAPLTLLADARSLTVALGPIRHQLLDLLKAEPDSATGLARRLNLATLTLETDIAFASPRDFKAFATDLQQAIQQLTQRYHQPGGRRQHVLIASHPAPRTEKDTA